MWYGLACSTLKVTGPQEMQVRMQCNNALCVSGRANGSLNQGTEKRARWTMVLLF